jgi:putative oxidoreductase
MIDIGILIVRVVVGLYVAGHGAQKLFGWFGGPGIDATVEGMRSHLGLRPARFWVTSLSATEVIGGVLMAIGFLGPLGPIAVAGTMLGATVFGHWANGPWIAKGGYELTITNLAVALAVALLGVGSFSIDALLGLIVPPIASEVFSALVVLGVLAAGLSRRPQPVQSSARVETRV